MHLCQYTKYQSQKILLCTVSTCKIIGNCSYINIFKVLFDSGSTKAMIHLKLRIGKVLIGYRQYGRMCWAHGMIPKLLQKQMSPLDFTLTLGKEIITHSLWKITNSTIPGKLKAKNPWISRKSVKFLFGRGPIKLLMGWIFIGFWNQQPRLSITWIFLWCFPCN